MNAVVWVIVGVWAIRLLVNLLSYIHLWYVKEYRWDRMLIHLRTKQGKKILLIPFRKPPVSPKTVTLSVSSLVAVVAIIIFLPLPVVVRFLVADLSLFPLTFLLVGLLQVPTLVYHAAKIRMALAKLHLHKPMTVIGITGSYGKTSTKEYLATILGSARKVLKTPASKNSAIGIAEVVLSALTPDHEVFIAEMGAYKRGEIHAMTDMMKPEIGIITAINPQHQDLFGTIETTMRAKYELIQGLIGRRIAILNADNEYVRRMARWAKRDGVEVWSVGRKSHTIGGAKQYVMVNNVTGDGKGISFLLTVDSGVTRIRARVLGEHLATNIALAVSAALAAGLPLSQAAKAAATVRPFAKTMQPISGINGSLFIDDTFNNNPDAAIAALHFLGKTKGRKILVFQPMIELGTYAGASHTKVGEHAGRICDDVILTNSNFLEYFKNGMEKTSSKKVPRILSPGRAADYIRSRVRPADTVLFKGKEAEQVLKRLTGWY